MVREWQCDRQNVWIGTNENRHSLGKIICLNFFFLSRRKESFCLAFSPLAYQCRWEVLWACFHIRRSLLLLKHARPALKHLHCYDYLGMAYFHIYNFSPLRMKSAVWIFFICKELRGKITQRLDFCFDSEIAIEIKFALDFADMEQFYFTRPLD